MKKIASYSHFSSKVLAVVMAALLASFSLTPLALADEAGAPTATEPTEADANATTPGEEVSDGKIHLTLALPSKSFVYDGQAHSVFDKEAGEKAAAGAESSKDDQSQKSEDGDVRLDEGDVDADEATNAPSDETDVTTNPEGTDQDQVQPSDEAVSEADAQEPSADSVEGSSGEPSEGAEPAEPAGPADPEASTVDASAHDLDADQGTSPDTAVEDTTDATNAVDAANATNTTDATNSAATTDNQTPEVVVDIEGAVDEAPAYPTLTMTSPEEFTFTHEGALYTVKGLVVTEVTATDIGTVEYTATGTPQIFNSENMDVSDTFALEIMPGTLTIEQRSLVLVSDSLIKTYEPGVALVDESGKVSVEGDGFLAGDGAQYTFTGSQEEVGASLNTFTYEFDEGTDPEVYKVTEKPGTLRVTSLDFDSIIPITVEAVSETLPYDGEEHYLIDYATSTFSLDDEADAYTVQAADEEAVAATNVGEYTFEPTGPFTVVDSYGNDVSRWFDIDWQPVTLTIEPRTMYLKVNDQTKLYGEEDPAFTCQFLAADEENEYTDQLAAEDDLGEITLNREEGEAVGEYAIFAEYEDNENYNLTVEEGTLSITGAKIELAVESVDTVYDGQAHSVEVTCDASDVMVLYKIPDGEWGEENPSYTEIGTYPVYVQALPMAGNEGNTASDVIEAQIAIASNEPAAEENPDETGKTDGEEDVIVKDDPSNATPDEPQGPASPEEDPDFAERTPSAPVPSNTTTAEDLSVPDNVPSLDADDLTIPETASTDVPSNDLNVPNNELADDTTPDSELLATTSSDNAVGANSTNKAKSSETVPMTVDEPASTPFNGVFGIVAVGIIILAICGIGAAIYLWRTKETEE